MKYCPLAGRIIARDRGRTEEENDATAKWIFDCWAKCQWYSEKLKDCRLIVALERIAEGMRK